MRRNKHSKQPMATHPPVFALCATIVAVFSVFVVLDTFVLQRTYAVVTQLPTEALAQEAFAGIPVTLRAQAAVLLL